METIKFLVCSFSSEELQIFLRKKSQILSILYLLKQNF